MYHPPIGRGRPTEWGMIESGGTDKTTEYDARSISSPG